MARYQILYWKHIPLGVKATDLNGTVRQNLPVHFQEEFQLATAHNKASNPYTTSGFRWDDELEREGNATEVAVRVVKELIENWNHETALALYEAQKSKIEEQFIQLKKLQP